MLETGLALIAVNLPSIWGLVSHSSVNAVLTSLRGLLFLDSKDSSGVSRRYTGLDNEWHTRKSSTETGQNIRLTPNSRNAQINTSAMRDLEGGYELKNTDGRAATRDGIDVQWNVEQTETWSNIHTKL